MKLSVPSVNQVLAMAITMVVVFFILRFLPESVKGLFRV